jgi:hypothetical protein
VKRLSLAFAVALGSLLAVVPAPASAETVTVGSPLAGSFTRVTFCIPLCISANQKLAAPGAQVTVPFDGTLTRWRTIEGKGGALRIRVLRADGSGEYVLAGTSSSETPAGPGIDTFATSLPVKAGDLIGLENLSISAEVGTATPAGSEYHAWFGSFPDGANTSSAISDNPHTSQEIGFNADVERPSIAPPPVVPPALTPKCVVPALNGKKLKAAKKKIRAAGCKLGKVSKRKGATAVNGKVVNQGPKAGKVVAAGTAVKVTLAATGGGKAG